jgi:hypothetical protein
VQGCASAQQGRQQVEGIGARPLEIIEYQECARRSCHVGQNAGHRGIHEPPLLLRRQGPKRHRLQICRQLWQQAHQPAAAAHGNAPPGWLRGLQVLRQRVKQGGVRLLASATVAARGQHAPASGDRVLGGSLQEARLAYPRLTSQQQHRRRSQRRRLSGKEGVQKGQLGCAPHQRYQGIGKVRDGMITTGRAGCSQEGCTIRGAQRQCRGKHLYRTQIRSTPCAAL